MIVSDVSLSKPKVDFAMAASFIGERRIQGRSLKVEEGTRAGGR